MAKLLVFGDSILKGVQVNDKDRYEVHDIGFNAKARNVSKFGCTVTKALGFAERTLDGCDASVALMDFGGNDSDYDWKAIAANPSGIHRPKTEIFDFANAYMRLIDMERTAGIEPVMTTLPSIDGQRYCDWFCRQLKLKKANVLSWLGSTARIAEEQERYSYEASEIARKMGVKLVDLRSCFLSSTGDLLCRDGIHPNLAGQRVIKKALDNSLGEFMLAV